MCLLSAKESGAARDSIETRGRDTSTTTKLVDDHDQIAVTAIRGEQGNRPGMRFLDARLDRLEKRAGS